MLLHCMEVQEDKLSEVITSGRVGISSLNLWWSHLDLYGSLLSNLPLVNQSTYCEIPVATQFCGALQTIAATTTIPLKRRSQSTSRALQGRGYRGFLGRSLPPQPQAAFLQVGFDARDVNFVASFHTSCIRIMRMKTSKFVNGRRALD